jgi:Fic family protein
MGDTSLNIHALDAAYKPFPTFSEWSDQVRVESSRWDRYRESLEASYNLSQEQLARARNIAKRAAAFDTGAIEGLYETERGFTYSIAFETAAWEAALSAKGEQVRSLFEAQMQAYDYVLDLATKAEPTSEAAIRVLHEIVCKAQTTYRVVTAIGPQEQPLPKGQYKVLANHVRTRKATDHAYAPVDVTPSEMQRLVTELRRPEFLNAHPAVQAAYAHYGLVVVHPFADGNGRVARALASVFAYRSISMPIVILSEQKEIYLNALEAADSGDYQVFVRFLLDRLLDTMNLVEDSIKTAIVPNPASELSEIDKLYLTRGGYTDEQVDAFGGKLVKLIEAEVEKFIQPREGGRISVKGLVRTSTRGIPASAPRPQVRRQGVVAAPLPPPPPALPHVPNVPSTHREPFAHRMMVTVTVTSAAPAHATVAQDYILFVPKDAAGDDDLKLFTMSGRDSFSARVDEVESTTPGILQFRLGMFAERIVGEALSEIKARVANAMRARRG